MIELGNPCFDIHGELPCHLAGLYTAFRTGDMGHGFDMVRLGRCDITRVFSMKGRFGTYGVACNIAGCFYICFKVQQHNC